MKWCYIGIRITGFIFSLPTLCWVAGISLLLPAGAQTPLLQSQLSATTARQPAKPQDTIFYTAVISNTGDTSTFEISINRIGDPNTTLVIGSFKSTPVAIPASFADILEDKGFTLVLQGIDPDGDPLQFSIIRQPQQGILSTLAATSNTESTLTYTPNPHVSGMDQFTFSVTDAAGNHDTSAVALHIVAVNDPPAFTSGMDLTLLEDAGQQVLPNWATNISSGPADEAIQLLEFHISNNDNSNLFEEQPVLNPNGTLTFWPAENGNGVANLILRLKDNGGNLNGGIDTTQWDTFRITVLPVNDPPAFLKGADIVIKTNPTMQTFANWASEIKAGPVDEQMQVLSFVIESNDNTALFEEGPAIDSNGTLTFKPAPGAIGKAMITIRLKDDGGIVNGGMDVSDIQTFSITFETSEE